MEYVHIKNLEKYQPGYKDRRHIWAKIYYETFLDEEVQKLIEIDRYRFWSLIVFEVYTQKPVPLTDTNLKIMGWDGRKRRISLTLQMLHTLTDVCNGESNVSVPQSRVEESRVEESRVEKKCFLDFVFLSEGEYKKLIDIYGEQQTKVLIGELNDYLGSTGKKYKSHYYTLRGWARRNNLRPTGNPQNKVVQQEIQRRKRLREESEPYLRAKSTKALRDLRKDKGQIQIVHWLIDEILAERTGK